MNLKYKNICPPNRDILWKYANCENADNIQDLAKRTISYKRCSENRKKFDDLCVENPDRGHNGAVNKMMRFSKKCENTGKQKNDVMFKKYYDCLDNDLSI